MLTGALEPTSSLHAQISLGSGLDLRRPGNGSFTSDLALTSFQGHVAMNNLSPTEEMLNMPMNLDWVR